MELKITRLSLSSPNGSNLRIFSIFFYQASKGIQRNLSFKLWRFRVKVRKLIQRNFIAIFIVEQSYRSSTSFQQKCIIEPFLPRSNERKCCLFNSKAVRIRFYTFEVFEEILCWYRKNPVVQNEKANLRFFTFFAMNSEPLRQFHLIVPKISLELEATEDASVVTDVEVTISLRGKLDFIWLVIFGEKIRDVVDMFTGKAETKVDQCWQYWLGSKNAQKDEIFSLIANKLRKNLLKFWDKHKLEFL